ncbi:MAG TPA: LysR family transcriptional regulator [Steroidobacteraceae bacterium]|nr:LysR family transcriptional regulator [Steroidobacteraceae bacterium]
MRHLRYFLAVAEELNFTRAARRLNIAQPPLTQQIKALEAELGVTLIDRSAYHISLTRAGQAFAAEVTRILGEVRNAVLIAKRAARGAVGQLRVGFTESASFNPLVTSTFRSFRSVFPDIEVSLEERQSTQLVLALREGRIDVAFVRPPLKTGDGLSLQLLQEEEMVAAVPSGHALAKRKSIDLRELANEAFILYPRAVRPGLADAVVAACEKAGFSPRVEQYAPQLAATINLVAASLGVSVVPLSMQGLQPGALAYIPLRGRPVRAQLSLAHRTDEASPAVLQFIELTREAARGAP